MVRGDNEVVTEPEFPEQFRSYSENEKHWQARRAFILRNAPLEGGEAPTPLRLEQLLSLSMVWANHLFLGCSYNKDLLEKVMEMANGIEVEDVPHFTTRDELLKRKATGASVKELLSCDIFRLSLHELVALGDATSFQLH